MVDSGTDWNDDDSENAINKWHEAGKDLPPIIIHPEKPKPNETNNLDPETYRKYHSDILDYAISNMQESSFTKFESIIIGIILAVAGFALCFLGASVTLAILGLVTTLSMGFLITCILCSVFEIKF